MRILEPGHIYQLNTLDADYPHEVETLRFVNREKSKEHPGTQTQEVLRALIDRTMHCDNCKRWAGNDKIIHHLRMALALHEARALERKAEKELYRPEDVMTNNSDGHYQIVENNICMPERDTEGKAVISDAEIYLRKDKDEEAEGQPASFRKMWGMEV